MPYFLEELAFHPFAVAGQGVTVAFAAVEVVAALGRVAQVGQVVP